MKNSISNHDIKKLIAKSNDINLDENKSCELPKYTSVQCISFNIGTLYGYNDYHGIRDENLDSKERCKVMKDAIDIAEKSDKIDNSSNCMKVFMAPEFFFRGVDGGYKMETAIDVVKNLQSIVNEPKYKDWLFVFGSIVCFSKGNDYYGAPVFEAYNFSLIHKGNTDPESSRIVMKENMSLVDFAYDYGMGSIKLFGHNTQHMKPINSLKPRDENKIWNYDGNAVFEIDGIRIGVEICLDNIERRNERYKKDIKEMSSTLLESFSTSLITDEDISATHNRIQIRFL